jgi:chemotaxis protein CheX
VLARVPDRDAVAGEGACCAAVGFTGAWKGRLVVCLDLQLAADLSRAWFGHLPDGAEVADAVKEAANEIAGQLKSLLPAPTALGLPAWCPDQDPAPSTLARIDWSDRGLVLHATVEGG